MFGIKRVWFVLLGLFFFFFITTRNGVAGKVAGKWVEKKDSVSLRHEVQHAIDRGLQYLEGKQAPGGYWSQAEYPALTGLCLTAFMRDPSGRIKAKPPLCVKKGYEYLLKNVKPDGGIYVHDLSNYNTSVCMMALVVAYNPSYEPVLRKARNFLAGLQDESADGGGDAKYAGGIGYGGSSGHSDITNTMYALEAIYYTRFLASDKGRDHSGVKKLDWPAAIRFIERCQNLPGSNDQPWASGDAQNKGGFVYFPGKSMAGEMKLPSGRTALRSYGSASYSGLLSYIYADMRRDDPRVKMAYDWLMKNYTLDENPGMGPAGLYYYYHTMAKALSTYGTDKISLPGGKIVDWRKQLALKLLNLQREDGSWGNENGRWWERDPVLVTSYSVMTLEIIYKGLN